MTDEERKARKREYQRQWKAKWRAENPEKDRATAAKWRAKNPDHIKAKSVERYQTHREHILNYSKTRYASDKPRFLAARKEYLDGGGREVAQRHYEKNKQRLLEKHRKWWRDNPEKTAVLNKRRRVRKVNAPGRHDELDIAWLLFEQDCRCAGCDAGIRERYSVDHVVPLSKGGSDDRENLQLLCRPCNSSKKDKPLDEWMFVAKRTRLCDWPRKLSN